jgi:hypothetical protein
MFADNLTSILSSSVTPCNCHRDIMYPTSEQLTNSPDKGFEPPVINLSVQLLQY